MTPDEAIALVQKYGMDAQVRVDGYSTWQDAACVLAGEVAILRDHVRRFSSLAESNAQLCDTLTKRHDRQMARLKIWERFVPYLIDNHEKEVIYEESIQRWLAEMLDKEKANQIEGGE